MLFCYTLTLYLLAPFALLRLAWLGRRNPAYRRRWLERFGFTPALGPGGTLIWIHTVSVGEVQAARPLVEYLQKRYPGHRILVTTVTPSGADMAAQAFAGGVSHRYFPYDLPFAVSRFLRVIRPGVLLVFETEIWPNLYRQCRRRGIPVALVNARLSARSLKGYRLVAGLARETLSCLSVLAAQSGADADRFLSLGAPPDVVRVTGNLKFDVRIPHSVLEQAEVLRRRFSAGRPVWIAASTHEGEEKAALEAMDIIRAQRPGSLLIIAPRHPERFEEVAALAASRGYQTARYTRMDAWHDGIEVFILDTLGQLPAFYAASDVAFVGGSLVPIGGHNMLEPACLGVPVVCGRHLHNFNEITALLAGAGVLFRVDDAAQLAAVVLELLDDPNRRFALGERARQVVAENQGTINKIVKVLEEVIPGEESQRN